MTMSISPAHNDARLVGTMVFAGAGSIIQLFVAEHPTLGGTPSETPLVQIVLANPCGAVVSHLLVLHQNDAGGDLVALSGAAVWARWVTAAGELIADGSVTDASGAGDFKLSGTSGTMIYAGARVLLGASAIG